MISPKALVTEPQTMECTKEFDQENGKTEVTTRMTGSLGKLVHQLPKTVTTRGVIIPK